MKDRAAREKPYELVINGELDGRYECLFEGARMEVRAGTTVLSATLRDQTQLYGLIERIEELGLELLSVQQATTSPVGSGHERTEG